MALSLAEIKEQLDYCPVTGLFRWRVSKPRAAEGSIAGFSCSKGYRRVKVSGSTYATHRLAWAFSNGRWPRDQIDHVNGVRDDNRLSNLREATAFENSRNRRQRKPSKSGYKGVTKQTLYDGYQATCRVNGVSHYLGSFSTPEEAAAAYDKFTSIHHKQFYNASMTQGESTVARPKSVILSSAEKKTIVAELKAKLKAAKDEVKVVLGDIKEADKAYALAGKTHIAALKASDKAQAATSKAVAALEAQLSALTAPVEA